MVPGAAFAVPDLERAAILWLLVCHAFLPCVLPSHNGPGVVIYGVLCWR